MVWALLGWDLTVWRSARLGFPNVNFWLQKWHVLSDTKITFSQGDATKIRSKQFSEFGSRTIMIYGKHRLVTHAEQIQWRRLGYGLNLQSVILFQLIEKILIKLWYLTFKHQLKMAKYKLTCNSLPSVNFKRNCLWKDVSVFRILVANTTSRVLLSCPLFVSK